MRSEYKCYVCDNWHDTNNMSKDGTPYEIIADRASTAASYAAAGWCEFFNLISAKNICVITIDSSGDKKFWHVNVLGDGSAIPYELSVTDGHGVMI